MFTMFLMRFIWVALLSATLAACGGGGGGSSAPARPPVNVAPVAAFDLDINSGSAPLEVTVDARASADPDGHIVAYQWDFAGESAIGPIAQYTFTQPGTFSITLTVSDNDTASTSTSRTVTVNTAAITARLSGTVRILNSTAVDSDVNDRLTTPVSNNSFALAQALPTPVTLGGFANRPNQGASTGNLFTSGDSADFYQVSLNGDELISLTIAEANTDLDLRLWDEQRNIVDASLNNLGETETLEVMQPGSYYIEVTPVSGASNYVLSVGQNVSAASQQRSPSRLSDPFVAGELIVKRQSTPAKPGPFQYYLAPKFPEFSPPSPAAEIYKLKTSTRQHLQNKLRLPTDGQVTRYQYAKLETLAALKSVQGDPSMQYAELNLLARTHTTPNDSFYGSQWHYPAINLPVAWDTTTGSNNVIVAIIDTGVLLDHPDLANRLVQGYDFISNDTRSRDNEPGIDNNPDDPGDLQYGGSSSFHGTHVAGTVGANSDNASGVSGVTWQTRIMPLRALGKDGGTTFDILQAVRYAAGLSNTSGTLPVQRADIINLSLGTTFSSQSEQDTYTEVSQAGVIVIASAGNDSSSLPSYPAAYNGVIGVSASTITNDIAGYSNFGAAIDIAAPGGSKITDLNGDGIGDGVISTMGDDSGATIQFGYATLSGTSMAAPHVAGVVALMKAVHPNLTPSQFTSALAAGDLTDDMGAPGRDDRYGFGLLNAQKALIAAQQLATGQGSDPGPILTASASTLNFGGFTTTLDLSLQNVGSGDIQITGVSVTEPWVTVTPPTTSDGLGTYAIDIDRNGLSDGAYQATVTFSSDANTVSLNLIMQVSQLNLSANAGLFYIILVDENGATEDQALVNVIDGEYRFTLTNVTAGQYRLFAGSDADDDAKLCDAGEACGAYPTLDSPDFIAINGDLTHLDFEAGFRVNLTTNINSLSRPEGGESPIVLSVDKARAARQP